MGAAHYIRAKLLLNHRLEFIRPVLGAVLLGILVELSAAAARPPMPRRNSGGARAHRGPATLDAPRHDRRDALSGQLRDAEENVRGARENSAT
jgi:hypothetical protein